MLRSGDHLRVKRDIASVTIRDGSLQYAVFVTEIDCPDCGYDPYDDSSRKTMCVVCGGEGVTRSEQYYPFRASVEWGSTRVENPWVTGMVIEGDVLLRCVSSLSTLIDQVVEPHYLLVDQVKVRPTKMIKARLNVIDAEVIYGCKKVTK